jgi:hypothetical protein
VSGENTAPAMEGILNQAHRGLQRLESGSDPPAILKKIPLEMVLI